MMQFLELTVDQATIIAIALPIIAVCLFILVTPWLKTVSGSKLRRYLSYLVTPPQIDTSISETSDDNPDQTQALGWRNTKVKIFFYYFGIVLFLVSFGIGEFYEVMFDLLLPVQQGSTGEYRIVTSIVFQTPYIAGWIGALPWSGLFTYHETWNWIFFTAGFTDNPDFLTTLVAVMFLISAGIGTVYLIPLAVKRIRHSFLPSMFFFMTGMTIFTKEAIGCLAYALALAFGNAELVYSNMVTIGGMIPNLAGVLAFSFLIVFAMFALFILLGRKLWQTHYSDSKSRNWFMAYIALSYWLGLALTFLLV
jgi:hypothetical protein